MLGRGVDAFRAEETGRPLSFTTTRHVWARDEAEAKEKALRLVRTDLSRLGDSGERSIVRVEGVFTPGRIRHYVAAGGGFLLFDEIEEPAKGEGA